MSTGADGSGGGVRRIRTTTRIDRDPASGKLRQFVPLAPGTMERVP